MTDTTGFVLYEVRLGLASETRLVRVRAPDPEQAIHDVLTQFPGWAFVDLVRWQGESWIRVSA